MKHPPNKPTKCIFYARVSSEGQIDNTSIDDQTSRGKAYALSQGWILEKIFIDNGESGKSTNRTAFKIMLSYIENNPVDVLLTFKLDRLSRSLKDLLIFIDDTLECKGIALQSVTENFNTQSAEGKLFLQLLGSFAEFERKRINQRTMSGKIATAKKGNWNGGHIPFGYRKCESSQNDLIPEPQEAETVKKIFQLYSKGYGFIRIKKLTNCPLSVQGISDLVKNPFYCGKVKYTNIVESNNHPAIISEKLFCKCQKVRKIKTLN